MIPLRDTIPSGRFPIVTVSLIGINVLVFCLELTFTERELARFFRTWGIVPWCYSHTCRDAGYWTLVSSMFLHGGWMHIIGNMWSLWIFGDNVEERLGRGGFLCFYLAGGLAAGLLHIATNLPSRVPTVGASGAIAGVMGAYLLLFPSSTVVTLVPIFFFMQVIEVPAVVFLGLWFLSNVWSGIGALASASARAGGVAWWAHIGGFLVGVLWALPLRRRLPTHHRARYYDDEHW